MISNEIVSSALLKFFKEEISYRDTTFVKKEEGTTLIYESVRFTYLFKIYLGVKGKIVFRYNKEDSLSINFMFDDELAPKINFDALTTVVRENTTQEFLEVSMAKYVPNSSKLSVKISIPNECYKLETLDDAVYILGILVQNILIKYQSKVGYK